MSSLFGKFLPQFKLKLGTKAVVGAVLLILGVMHFFNLFVLNRFRRRGLESKAPPPVLPNEYLARKAS